MLSRTPAARLAAAAATSIAAAGPARIANLPPRTAAPLPRPPRNVEWADAKQHLASLRPVQYSKLSNGFRCAVEHIPDLEFVTIGVWIDAGSRFETRANNGVAHFLEHMNFKGCKRYTKPQIESAFEQLGAHFNAYTARDRTAYYIKVFNKDVPLVMDLLASILKEGIYDRRFIEMERPTILAEMRDVEAIVEEVIMDNLHIAAYDGSRCGLPLTILGPIDNISKHIDRDMIVNYIDTHYTAPRMSLVSSGGLSIDQVHALAEEHFADLSPKSHRPLLNARYVGGTATLWNSTMATAHAHIAFPVCGAANKDVVTLQLLHYFYGSLRRDQMSRVVVAQQQGQQGEGAAASTSASRRPFFADLEKMQFFFTPYEETGLMGYQLVTVPAQAQQADTLALMHGHIMSVIGNLVEHPPSVADLEGAKCAYKASQFLMVDSTTNSAEDLGRQMVHFGRRIPAQELFEHIDQVTPVQFSETLAKYFDNVRPTISAAGPPAALPHFDALRELVERTAVTAN